MSIRPTFVEAILSGSKTVEFRKRRLAPDVQRVMIYSTAPVQAVVGEFEVEEQITTSPASLWRRFGSVSGVDRKVFFKYFEGSREGVGIVIKSVMVYDEPAALDTLISGARPPQSFQYLDSPAA
jgi:predicted transcriptional regulator